jgi:hypothetical protein
MQAGGEKAAPKRSGETRGEPSRGGAWLRDGMATHRKRLETYGNSSPWLKTVPDGPVNAPKGYRGWREGESSPKADMGHLIYPISVQNTARSGIGLAKPLPTPSCRAYQCERGRLWYGGEGEQSTDDLSERRRPHRSRRTGKPSTGRRGPGD